MAIDRNLVRTIIGIIGNLISFGFFAAPAPTFYNIIKRRAVDEDFSPNMQLASILDCALWLLYGLPNVHPHSILIATVSGVGLAVEFAYVIIYFYYANKKQRWYVALVLAVEVVFYARVVFFTFSCPFSSWRRQLVAGMACFMANFFMLGMPPCDIMFVIRLRRDVSCFNLLAIFLYELTWLTYALLRFDLFLTIASVTGIVLSLILLVNFLCSIYYKSTPKRVHPVDIENT